MTQAYDLLLLLWQNNLTEEGKREEALLLTYDFGGINSSRKKKPWRSLSAQTVVCQEAEEKEECWSLTHFPPFSVWNSSLSDGATWSGMSLSLFILMGSILTDTYVHQPSSDFLIPAG